MIRGRRRLEYRSLHSHVGCDARLCDTLATIDSGVFRLKQDQWRPDRTEYRHEGCTKAKGNISPSALSVRFLLACREGHLTDFPWLEFVHKGNVACKPAQLTLREYGISGDASDIIVQCLACNSNRRMSDAFDQDAQFKCPGHHPHLRRIDHKPCEEVAKSILLGASNSWFSVSLSALSIPLATDRLAKLVEEQWGELKASAVSRGVAVLPEDVAEVSVPCVALFRFQRFGDLGGH